jgi:hypothetical protein
MREIDKLFPLNSANIPKSGNKYSDSKNKIKEICESLSKDSSSYNPKATIQLISEYKRDESYLNRILYSDISAYIYMIDDQTRDNFISNTDQLITYAYRDETQIDIEIKGMIVRICDHSNLANQQKVLMLKDEIVGLSNLVEQCRSDVNESKTTITSAKEEYEQSSKRMQREYISIFGIFSAIIIAFVGGLSFTSSILQSINASSRYRISFIAALIAFFIMNIVEYLIDFLLKITEHKKSDSKSHITRSVLFWVTNIVLILIMIGSTVCFFLDRYRIISI